MGTRRRGRSPRGRRTRRLAVALLVTMIPVGAAYLAQNSVTVSYTDQVNLIVIPPRQAAIGMNGGKVNVAHAGTYQFTNMKATLTGPSGPAPDATIVFRVAGVVVCTETTKTSGEAICTSNRQFDRSLFHPVGADPLSYPYTATFAGSSALEGVTVTGTLEKDTGNGGTNHNDSTVTDGTAPEGTS